MASSASSSGDSSADPHAAAWERTAGAILQTSGALDPAFRRAIRDGADPADLAPLLDKVRRRAYTIVDTDLPAGRSEDEVLEAVLAAALGVAEERLRAGLAAL